MRTIGLLAGSVLFLAAACTVIVDPAPSQACAVGKAGTDLQISYSGPNADASCAAQLGADSSYYAVDQPDSTGALICRYTIQQVTVTVRDKGILKLEGNSACQQLKAQAGA